MLRALFRATSLLFLAIALISVVLDVTRSIADSSIVMTPLFIDWLRLSPTSLDGLRQATETYVHRFAWDPVMVTILRAPTWLAFGLAAILIALHSATTASPLAGKFRGMMCPTMT